MINIAVIVNKEKDAAHKNLRLLANAAEGKARLMLDSEKQAPIAGLNVEYMKGEELYTQADIVVVLGGDGTLLSAVRDMARYELPIAGVNLGRIGYLTAIEKNDITELIDRLISGDYTIESRMMLEGEISGNSKTKLSKSSVLAFNDIVLTRTSFSRMIHINVSVNGELLEAFTADGVIVSSPTGSTAYSLSAGGPIVDPCMELILVTPICPHDLHSRTIVLPADREVEIKLGSEGVQDAMFTVDGQEGHIIESGNIMTVKKAPFNVKLIRTGEMSFYELLRRKLKGGRSNA